MTTIASSRALAGLAVVVVSVANAQTYSKDIAPIILHSCAPCHRPGESAPFSLLDYRDVKSHATQIVQVTKSGYMPPWKPAAGRGDFEGERRLTDRQLEVLRQWVSRGAPEGDPKQAPPSPKFVTGWQLGTPDMVVTLNGTYTLAPSGRDVFRNFVLRVPLDRKRYVRALEIRPGPKTVVHHANALIDRERTMRRRDGQDGTPGFAGMDVEIESRSFDPESHFLFWKPGTTVLEEPADMAWELDPGDDLILNMHLRPSGKPESIQPSVGLYFTDKAPSKHPMLLQMEHDGALAIEPGQSAFVVTDTLTLPVDADVLAVYPHGHYIAKDMQAFATLPDASKRWLIHIPDWDLNWQAVYRYKEPTFLPKGTTITMRYTYDNSENNPRNPSHPPARVVSGDQSTDEMAHFWLQVLPHAGADTDGRLSLQRALMLRRLEKYPGDFQAHFSLGSLSQEQGDLAAAETHYRAALQGAPKSAIAHNSLGSALLEGGRPQEAGAEFRTAMQLDPDYADAHYNLARVLLSAEQIPEAIQQLQHVIRLEPEDAPALSDLGAALSMTGQPEQGLSLLRKAVEHRPDYFNGHYNLAQALAAAGKAGEAKTEFERALRLKPGDQDVLEALKRLGSQ